MTASQHVISIQDEIQFSVAELKFLFKEDQRIQFMAQLISLNRLLSSRIPFDAELILFLKELNKIVKDRNNFNPLFARQMLMILQQANLLIGEGDATRKYHIAKIIGILHIRFQQADFKSLYGSNGMLIENALKKDFSPVFAEVQALFTTSSIDVSSMLPRPVASTSILGPISVIAPIPENNFYQRYKRIILITTIGLILGAIIGPFAAAAITSIELANTGVWTIVGCSSIGAVVGGLFSNAIGRSLTSSTIQTSLPASTTHARSSMQLLGSLNPQDPTQFDQPLRGEKKQEGVPRTNSLNAVVQSLKKNINEADQSARLQLINFPSVPENKKLHDNLTKMRNDYSKVITILDKIADTGKIKSDELTCLEEYRDAYDRVFVTGIGRNLRDSTTLRELGEVISLAEVTAQPNPWR